MKLERINAASWEAFVGDSNMVLQHGTRPVLVIFKLCLVHRSPYSTQASETRPSRIHTSRVTCKCFPAVYIDRGKLHMSPSNILIQALSCWQTLIPLKTLQQNVFLCWKSLLARILLIKNGSQWWGYLWNREEKQILFQLLRHTKSEVDPQSQVMPWAKLFHWIFGTHTLIRPAQSLQQALFRVPGDLEREDDLCKKIAPTELVSKN